jgi:hypothetical protein
MADTWVLDHFGMKCSEYVLLCLSSLGGIHSSLNLYDLMGTSITELCF